MIASSVECPVRPYHLTWVVFWTEGGGWGLAIVYVQVFRSKCRCVISSIFCGSLVSNTHLGFFTPSDIACRLLLSRSHSLKSLQFDLWPTSIKLLPTSRTGVSNHWSFRAIMISLSIVFSMFQGLKQFKFFCPFHFCFIFCLFHFCFINLYLASTLNRVIIILCFLLQLIRPVTTIRHWLSRARLLVGRIWPAVPSLQTPGLDIQLIFQHSNWMVYQPFSVSSLYLSHTLRIAWNLLVATNHLFTSLYFLVNMPKVLYLPHAIPILIPYYPCQFAITTIFIAIGELCTSIFYSIAGTATVFTTQGLRGFVRKLYSSFTLSV